jgi:D-xylose transport system substrate-binding protein
MNRRGFRSILLVALFALIVVSLLGCGAPAAEEPAAEEAAEVAADEPIKVGLSFSDFATERWKNEEVLMRGRLKTWAMKFSARKLTTT